MNVKDVEHAVEVIRVNGDPEIAHYDEDQMMVSVLEAVRDGNPEARWMAAVALQTQNFNMTRWYA